MEDTESSNLDEFNFPLPLGAPTTSSLLSSKYKSPSSDDSDDSDDNDDIDNSDDAGTEGNGDASSNVSVTPDGSEMSAL